MVVTPFRECERDCGTVGESVARRLVARRMVEALQVPVGGARHLRDGPHRHQARVAPEDAERRLAAQLVERAVGQMVARVVVNVAYDRRARAVGREHRRERCEQPADAAQGRRQRLAPAVELPRRYVVNVVRFLGQRVALAQFDVVITVFIRVENPHAPHDAADELVDGLDGPEVGTRRRAVEELGGLLRARYDDDPGRNRGLVVIARRRGARMVRVEQFQPIFGGHRLRTDVIHEEDLSAVVVVERVLRSSKVSLPSVVLAEKIAPAVGQLGLRGARRSLDVDDRLMEQVSPQLLGRPSHTRLVVREQSGLQRPAPCGRGPDAQVLVLQQYLLARDLTGQDVLDELRQHLLVGRLADGVPGTSLLPLVAVLRINLLVRPPFERVDVLGAVMELLRLVRGSERVDRVGALREPSPGPPARYMHFHRTYYARRDNCNLI